MKIQKKLLLYFWIFSFSLAPLVAQEETQESQVQEPEIAMSDESYRKAAPGIVKIVSDGGRKIGAGVILGVREDDLGFILTSYSTVARLEKVAVILKNHPDALLGRIVDKWIDFALDLAVITIRNFPEGQPVVTLGDAKSIKLDDTYALIAHTDTGDWLPIGIELAEFDDSRFAFSLANPAGLDGAPVLTKEGNVVGIVVSREVEVEEGGMSLAVKTSAMKPILDEWFKSIKLKQKWQERKAGLATWIWAVGGSILGGTIATAIAVAGGGDGGPSGLPRPPDPPPGPRRR